MGPSLEHCEHVAMGRAEIGAAGGSSGTKILSSVEVEEESTDSENPTNSTEKLEVEKVPRLGRLKIHRKALGKESLGAEVHHQHKHFRRKPTRN